MPHIVAAGGDVAAFTGGLSEFDVEAATVGRMIASLEAKFPGLGDHIERKMAIAIDGEIFQDARNAPLGAASEVYLIPRIGGG
ncbi:MAG: MoaD/ThiS family protein [Caulobacteraceae bacterium]